MADLEYREVEIREVTDSREISGLAVPYGEVIDVGGYRERFERGDHAFEPDALLFYGHDHRSGGMPVGRVIASRDTDAGLEVRVQISKTSKGDEVYQLARDGVLKKFSIGFEPISHREEDGVVVRTASRAKEVSITPFPAYASASITQVREEDHHKEESTQMSDENINEDVVEMRDTLAELERRIAVMAEERDENLAGNKVQFRTAGELLKALASGDEKARMELRAADATPPATSVQAGADFDNGGNWINRPLRFVLERRRTINLFSKAPLPAAGNTVEYPKVGSTNGTVAKQNAEGDALAYMEVELTTGSATVGTYGGYSRLSRQAIERSDMAYLDAVLRYQAIQYAKATEAVVRAAMTGAAGTGTATLAGDTVEGWLDLVIDGAAAIEDDSLGLQAEFMIVSRDVFKKIAHKTDSADRPVFALTGDNVNTAGRANLVKASANIAGLPVVVDPNLAANTCIMASSEALSTLESQGAPFRLNDESVVNLTKDFSLYGYLAVTLNDAKGLVVCDVDLV